MERHVVGSVRLRAGLCSGEIHLKFSSFPTHSIFPLSPNKHLGGVQAGHDSMASDGIDKSV